MPNKTSVSPKFTSPNSWSGTHGAKPAVVFSPQEGLDKLLPFSGAAPGATVALAGTVVVLCPEANTTVLVRQSLSDVNALLRHYFSLHSLLADQPPTGAVCLVVDFDDRESADLKFFERLKSSGWGLPIIVLAANPPIRAVVQLMRAGAVDVLLKSTAPGELATAVHAALNHARRRLQSHSRQYEVQRRMGLLSARELEIVKLILAGMLNKEIADRLNLSLVTVKAHRGSAMRKLGARNPAELACLTLAPNGLNAPEMIGAEGEND